MNKKGNALIWIGIILLILVVGYLIVGGYFSIHSYKMCSNECADKGTRFSDVSPNGESFNSRDLCICQYPNRTESFVMGDKNE